MGERCRLQAGFMHIERKLNGLLAVLPTLGVSIFGLGALGFLMLTAPSPRPQLGAFVAGQEDGPAAINAQLGTQFGVMFPPWGPSGLAAASALNLPIITLRWGGHLAIVDATGAPGSRAALDDKGFFTITTTAPPGCMIKRSSDA